jgi:hypothetical protein
MDTKKETTELPEPKKVVDKAITRCIYDEICSKKKMCGDCAADEYDREQYEEAWENFK